MKHFFKPFLCAAIVIAVLFGSLNAYAFKPFNITFKLSADSSPLPAKYRFIIPLYPQAAEATFAFDFYLSPGETFTAVSSDGRDFTRKYHRGFTIPSNFHCNATTRSFCFDTKGYTADPRSCSLDDNDINIELTIKCPGGYPAFK